MRMEELLVTDVLVVGGGTAGCLAALAAAEEGARVVLLERDDALGGVGTRAGINAYWYGSTGGIQHAVDSRCREWAEAFGVKSAGFHPDAKRAALTGMLAERGVDIRLQAIVYGFLTDGERIAGVMASTPDAIWRVQAQVTIDATGDGDVAAGMGEAFTLGRESDGATNACSLVPRTVEPNGAIAHLNYDCGFVDPTDPWDVSVHYRIGRQRIADLYASGTAPRIYAVAPQLGVREGRHIVGDYVLTWEDFASNRPFPDTVMTCYSHYDLHNMDIGFEQDDYETWTTIYGQFMHMSRASIPYRCLLPRKTESLLLASRAFSVDREAGMAVRMQRDMQKLGETAGVAAAMAVREGVAPRRLDITRLQERLIERGVLSRETLREPAPVGYQFATGELHGRGLTAADAPRCARELTGYFGTAEEGKAVLWLAAAEEAVDSALLPLLQHAEYPKRRGAAFALGARGNGAATPVLIEVFERRDGETDDGYKNMPRWIGALVLLRRLGCETVMIPLLELMTEEYPVHYYSLFFKYFEAMRTKLPEPIARRLAGELRSLADRLRERATSRVTHGGLSSDYAPYAALHAAKLLNEIGDNASGAAIGCHYANHESAFVRRLAQSLQLSEGGRQH